MASDKLTPKQARFVEEYMVDLNATQAAIRAGYAPKSADAEGGRQLGKVRVKAAIATLQAARMAKTEMDAEYVLSRIRTVITESLSEERHNPQAALKGLELLGRHMAMFTDKVVSRTTIEGMTDEQIADRLAQHDKPKLVA